MNQQFQLDAFGEALELLAVASSLDRLDTDHWDAVETAVAAIEQRWGEPDAGIWELDNQRWAHSRLACVAGLRSIAQHAPGSQSGSWSGLADAILADVSADCLHADGRWQRAPEDMRIDAALLIPGIRHAVPTSDPRTLATVNAVTDGALARRLCLPFRARRSAARRGRRSVSPLWLLVGPRTRTARRARDGTRPVRAHSLGVWHTGPLGRGVRHHPAPATGQPSPSIRPCLAARVQRHSAPRPI